MDKSTMKAFGLEALLLKKEGFAVARVWGVMPGLDNLGGYEDFLCVTDDGGPVTIRVHVHEGKRTHDYWIGWGDPPSQTKKEPEHA
jgi:hypothetical protein